MKDRSRPAIPQVPPGPDGVGEEVWIEVIRKMDEVYEDLVQHEVALEEKNAELEASYAALQRAHEALKRTQAQLLQAEKMASLGRLVAGVAHELNNPISFVLGNVHALRRYAGRLGRYLQAVHAGCPAQELAALRVELRIDRALEDMGPLVEGTVEGAERTRDIVDGLKRFSAVDREGDGPIDLVPVLARAIHWVEKGAAGGRSVGRTLPASLPVTGSAAQLQQVFMNLIQNALDACAGRPDAQVEVVARAAGHEAVVEVRDQGTGIDPAHLPRIFDPFFTTKPPGKGTGLGLAISYGIVQRHGGALTGANRPGGGAAFTVALPLRR